MTIAVPNEALTSGNAPVQINPPTPTNLSGQAEGMRSIALQWRSSTNEAEYEVYRADQSGGPFSTINRVGGTTFTDDGLIPGKTYYYRVRAVTASGVSNMTSAVSVTTDEDGESPSTPVSVRVESGNLSKAILRWEASSDNVEVAGYEIWANGELIGFSPIPAFEASNLEAGEVYEFYVVAIDLSGNKSGESERVNNEPFITDTEYGTPNGIRLSVYPNPGASQKIRIVYVSPASGSVSLQLTDMQNRELLSRDVMTTANSETLIPMEKYLANGLYILSVRQGTMSEKVKVVIQNE